MPAHFLPFTSAGRATELQAIRVKAHLGLGPYDSVDPFEVLPAVPARLVPDSILPSDVRGLLLDGAQGVWSAIGLGPSPVTGQELILLNPRHHAHRRRASLMEEIVHVVLKHPRVPLQFADGEGWRRPHNAQVEDEAFNVGAACIVPYQWLFNHLKNGNGDPTAIAKHFDLSVDYTEFRIKRAGLYRVYRKRSGTAP